MLVFIVARLPRNGTATISMLAQLATSMCAPAVIGLWFVAKELLLLAGFATTLKSLHTVFYQPRSKVATIMEIWEHIDGSAVEIPRVSLC